MNLYFCGCDVIVNGSIAIRRLPVSIGHRGYRLRYRRVHGVETGVERNPRRGRGRGRWRRAAPAPAGRTADHLVHGCPPLISQLFFSAPLCSAIAEPHLSNGKDPNWGRFFHYKKSSIFGLIDDDDQRDPVATVLRSLTLAETLHSGWVRWMDGILVIFLHGLQLFLGYFVSVETRRIVNYCLSMRGDFFFELLLNTLYMYGKYYSKTPTTKRKSD